MNLIGSRSERVGASSELDACGAFSVPVSGTENPGPDNVRWFICCSGVIVTCSWQRITTI